MYTLIELWAGPGVNASFMVKWVSPKVLYVSPFGLKSKLEHIVAISIFNPPTLTHTNGAFAKLPLR